MSFWDKVKEWWHKQNTTPSQRVHKTLANLEIQIPYFKDLMDKIPPIKWEVGTLAGDTLASTSIFTNTPPIITVDVLKIIQKRDRLEPVLGHEIFHVNDAYNKWGVEMFIATANDERMLPWESRSVERSAIDQENALRAFLIQHFPKIYSGMPRTRQAQNARRMLKVGAIGFAAGKDDQGHLTHIVLEH